MYRRLGHIGLYARRPVTCVPLTATHCRLRLTWSREHVLWKPQQWYCGMFFDESRFSLQSDSRWTLIWRAPSTRYHQENTIERHRYGRAGWLVWGGIILGSRTDLHAQSVTMAGHIYRDVILEQHVSLFWGVMGAEFLFMDDNACPHRAIIVEECLQSEDITRMDRSAYSPDLNPIERVWDTLERRIAARQPPPTCLPELQRALLDEWCNIPQYQTDNLYSACLGVPEIRFYEVEAQFQISRFSLEETKFHYLISQLEPKYIENIWDIVNSKSDSKYTDSKKRVLSLFRESENLRIKRLLTGIELGCMKPSQLLQKLKTVAKSDISENLIKTLWLEKLSEPIKNILVVSDENLSKLLVMSDKISDITPRTEIFATGRSSDCGEATSSKNQLLFERIQSLEEQICQLSILHKSRTKERNSFRPISRSRSRKRFDPKGKYCYFHFRFEDYKPCGKFRLFVKDRTTNLHFPVDSGADCSIIPATSKNKQPSDYKLFAANGTEIPAYGIKVLNIDLGLRREFLFPFIIAKVSKGILGADFLNKPNLLIDIRNKQLIEEITNLHVTVASENEEHKTHLKLVFERLQKHGLRVNISKSTLGVTHLEFLGYLITPEGSKPLQEKVDAILSYKLPETIRDLRTFLGLINFNRRYLKDAAKNQANLHEYLKGSKKNDKTKILWTEEAKKNFEKCKQ
ncbi:transposable element Tcb1 transposase [Trichonephila clavipes]|uniref:Transposable element Tcb1 transposase n=1 Tax=Trichonephila clavipes TaxID=2585209 RepID=A0A8X6VEJ1_TRICX|nr:transposable element Tcb1 transposase [Trichonephila clavipes]